MDAGNSDKPAEAEPSISANEVEQENSEVIENREPPGLEYETHLEGNINVIENQNNENLERDHERMEAEQHSASLQAKDDEKDLDHLPNEQSPSDNTAGIPPPLLEAAPSAPLSESIEDSIENRLGSESECIVPVDKESEANVPQENPENAEEQPTSTVNDRANKDDEAELLLTGNEDTRNAEKKPSVSEELKSTAMKNLEEKTTTGAEEKDDADEGTTSEPEIESITESTGNIGQKSGESSPEVNEHRTEVENVDVVPEGTKKVLDEGKGPTENIVDAIEEGEVSSTKDDENRSKTPENLEKSIAEPQASVDKPSDTDTTEDTAVSSTKDTETAPTPDEPSETITETVAEKPATETGENTEESEKPAESEKAPSETSDAIQSCEIGESASDIADHPENGESIQFAQVNFDHNNQKEGEDKDVEESDKDDVELDPIAATGHLIEDLEPTEDNREGADEELCIIPDDTERDIPKANAGIFQVASSSTTEEPGLRVKNFADSTQESSAKEATPLSFVRKCASCKKVTDDVETNLTWEIMDFCNEFCLSKYQREVGSKCSSCKGDVKASSLGKYCVRFGNDIRQFCTSVCLEQYKKGLKVCSYCQQDMSNGPDGFLAPVGDKGQFKDFCSKSCMEKYDIMTNDRPPKVAPGTFCSVCKTEKPITIDFELDGAMNYFCGEPCFVAFSFVNNISPGKCAMCRRHFNKLTLEQHTMYYDNVQYSFCSNSCENIYIIAHRKIVPCSWCKVKKYNFDMIKKYSKGGGVINMCSINCLSLFQVSLNAVNSKRITCNYCQKKAHPMYHLTMSDATIRNFCTYNCVMSFQNQFPKQPITLNSMGDSGFPVPTGAPKKNKKCPVSTTENCTSPVPNETASSLPVISSVQSLASTNGAISSAILPTLTPINTSRLTRSKTHNPPPVNAPATIPTPIPTITELPVQTQIKQHFIMKQLPFTEQRNVATMCSVRKAVKSVEAKPTCCDVGVQTEKEEASKILIPVPVPIYVPSPCHMFSTPVPVPVPFPLPIPIPIFIPTTRNSAAGIMKEIKKIQVKIPTDPYEAELLMMAEMVAEEKKEENTDSESDIDDAPGGDGGEYSPEPVDASNTFGDDMLQMALKMATELDEPAVDLEGALTANTITAPQGAHQEPPEENVDDPLPVHHHMMERGRKRAMRGGQRPQSKRGRRMSHQHVAMPMMPQVQQPPPPPEPQEKPDANMCLKYTFGVNAWKQWVTTKNAELEKSSRRVKLFKTEILQLTADELNYSLCLFVKEVRKPNGQEYAPDTIYYLCLGIQQYLFENGRIDNIFCDPYYEKFTDCLDEVAKKFSVLYNDSHYIVTRVEEEHLWESKQLGAHSPHVLLSTLMFFNTKHFNLTTVDEHMQLSFSHIMKHWKRNPNQPGAAKVSGSRNVLLRFYPPQSALQNNQRKKKVYEQQENEENPLRCPVKLYEFYLSKCPESVKTRNDVFYLQPERSCVPDSPVWYSTMPLPKDALEKMLHRVKMVKEINVALLTS